MKFDQNTGLIPAIIQDEKTDKVLMLGYMNEEAFEKTKSTGQVTFWSRSKQRLWTKGETSGNFLELKSWKLDCDEDTLLIKVDPSGPTCHTGTDTCWAEVNVGPSTDFLGYLEEIIQDRYINQTKDSYTSKLFMKGTKKIAQKVGEEATELVIEAMDTDDELFLGEAADLVFHLMILLRERNVSLANVIEVLKSRHK